MRGIWKNWLISFFKRKEQNIFKFVRDAPMSWHVHFDVTCFDELRHWQLERGFEKRLELIPGCWLRLFFCCQQILQIEKEFIKIQSLEIVVSNVWTQMVWIKMDKLGSKKKIEEKKTRQYKGPSLRSSVK